MDSQIDSSHLVEGLDFGVHDEGELAEFAGIRGRCCQPLLQAGLVHILQTARAVAGRQQRILWIALAVTDPADVAAVL